MNFSGLRDSVKNAISGFARLTDGKLDSVRFGNESKDESSEAGLASQVAKYWHISDFLDQEDAIPASREINLTDSSKPIVSTVRYGKKDRIVDIYVGSVDRNCLIEQLIGKFPETREYYRKYSGYEFDELGKVNLVHFALRIEQDELESGHYIDGSLEVCPFFCLLTSGYSRFGETDSLEVAYGSLVDMVKGVLPNCDCPVTGKHISNMLSKLVQLFPFLEMVDEWASIFAKPTNEKYPDNFRKTFCANDLELIDRWFRNSPDDVRLGLCCQYLSALDDSRNNGSKVDLTDSGESMAGSRRALIAEAFNPLHYPLGKWPSKYPLTAMQQFAVNLYSEEAGSVQDWSYIPGDVMAVNGPPGTGKTTLLKDVIASSVVQKAIILSNYERPDDMFEERELDCEKDHLPFIGKKPCDCYYKIKAEADAVNNYGILVCSTNNKAIENITLELPKRDGLLSAVEPEKGFSARRTSGLNCIYALFDSNRPSKVGAKSDDLFFTELANDLFCKNKIANCWGLISIPLGNNKNQSEYLEPVLKKFTEIIRLDSMNESLARYQKTRSAFRESIEDVKKFQSRLPKADEESLRSFSLALSGGLGSRNCVERLHDIAPGRDSSNNDAFDGFDRAREELFYWALQLIRDFVLASKACLYNFKTLYAMKGWMGQRRNKYPDSDREDAMPSLIQTLLLAVPVVSSTFDSVGNFLRDVRQPGTLGLLIVDEAGQALPYKAAGAMFRCRRALVVGDPRQVEPIDRPDRLGVLPGLFGKGMPYNYRLPGYSVQSYADQLNRFGFRENDEWVGTPLLVHRRCESPMFDISNEVSYSGAMIKRTSTFVDDGTLCRDSSFWVEVSGAEDAGAKNHYVPNQGEVAFSLLRDSFSRNEGIPDLFIISPFRSVRNGFCRYLDSKIDELILKGSSKAIDMEQLRNFEKNNIGTVHTFQGREAREVIFLLGCDEGSSGAVEWVKPNIVNVAASRAKSRLYVVGDSSVWRINPSVRKMKQILDRYYIDKLDELCSQCTNDSGVLSMPDDDVSVLDADLPEEALRVPDSIFAQYGFDSEDCFKNAFSDLDKETRESVCHFLLMGMKYADALGMNQADCAEEPSSSRERFLIPFWMLNQAFELVFNNRVYPVIKDERVCGGHFLGTGSTLSNPGKKKLTLGVYPVAIENYRESLVELTGGKRSYSWWSQYIKELKRAVGIRNASSHYDPNEKYIEKYLDYRKVLFEGWPDGGSLIGEGILRDTESFELVEERLKTGDCVRPSTSLSDSGIRPEAKEDTIFRNRCVEIPVCDKGADGRFDAIDFRVEGIRNCLEIKEEILLEVIARTADANEKRELEYQKSCYRKGRFGENKVRDRLVKSGLPIIVLSDLEFDYDGGHSAQIDLLAISPKCDISIEIKDYSAEVEQKSDGRFYRNVGKEKDAHFDSPCEQNVDHIAVLRSVEERLKLDVKPIYSLVVFSGNGRLRRAVLQNDDSHRFVTDFDGVRGVVTGIIGLPPYDIDTPTASEMARKAYELQRDSLCNLIDNGRDYMGASYAERLNLQAGVDYISFTKLVKDWKADVGSERERLSLEKLNAQEMNRLLCAEGYLFGGRGMGRRGSEAGFYIPTPAGRTRLGLVLATGRNKREGLYINNYVNKSKELEVRKILITILQNMNG